MVRIHLDDQMDSKALMGAYVCTARPGEFMWQPGPLTQAVAQGRWMLVEDINLAPPEVRVLGFGGRTYWPGFRWQGMWRHEWLSMSACLQPQNLFERLADAVESSGGLCPAAQLERFSLTILVYCRTTPDAATAT